MTVMVKVHANRELGAIVNKVLTAVEHLLTDKVLEVALGAAATTYLSTHSASAVAVAVLTASAASLGIHVSGALSTSATPPAAPKA